MNLIGDKLDNAIGILIGIINGNVEIKNNDFNITLSSTKYKINIPLDKKYITNKGVQDPSRLSKDDLEEYAFHELCANVLEVFGDVSRIEVNGTLIAQCTVPYSFSISSLDYDKIKQGFGDTNMQYVIGELAKQLEPSKIISDAENFLYVATVTKMEHKEGDFNGLSYAKAFLESIYDFEPRIRRTWTFGKKHTYPQS